MLADAVAAVGKLRPDERRAPDARVIQRTFAIPVRSTKFSLKTSAALSRRKRRRCLPVQMLTGGV
jgi:hypothetical protein